jgi:hypothetical protein
MLLFSWSKSAWYCKDENWGTRKQIILWRWWSQEHIGPLTLATYFRRVFCPPIQPSTSDQERQQRSWKLDWDKCFWSYRKRICGTQTLQYENAENCCSIDFSSAKFEGEWKIMILIICNFVLAIELFRERRFEKEISSQRNHLRCVVDCDYWSGSS